MTQDLHFTVWLRRLLKLLQEKHRKAFPVLLRRKPAISVTPSRFLTPDQDVAHPPPSDSPPHGRRARTRAGIRAQSPSSRDNRRRDLKTSLRREIHLGLSLLQDAQQRTAPAQFRALAHSPDKGVGVDGGAFLKQEKAQAGQVKDPAGSLLPSSDLLHSPLSVPLAVSSP